ncbi:protein of unknown function [Pararobbsia alpina]
MQGVHVNEAAGVGYSLLNDAYRRFTLLRTTTYNQSVVGPLRLQEDPDQRRTQRDMIETGHLAIAITSNGSNREASEK